MSDLISRAGLFNALANAQDKGEIFTIIQTIPGAPALNWLADDIHQNAVAHGWWDGGERNFGEIVALCHSELSEALEERRSGRLDYYVQDGKPEGAYTEMIDCMIRILDFLGSEQVDVDSIMEAKMKYNEARPYRHGGKEF